MWKRAYLWLIIGLFLLPVGLAETIGYKECRVGSSCTIVQPFLNDSLIALTNASCNITIQYNAVILINEESMYHQGGGYYAYNFTPNLTGEYPSLMRCGYGLEVAAIEVTFAATQGGLNMIAVVILLPLILGILFIIGAASLNEKHSILKIFAFFITVPLFWASAHYATISIVKFYDFPELQTALGTTVYWVGILFYMQVAYIFLFLIYEIITYIAENKKKEKEDREY